MQNLRAIKPIDEDFFLIYRKRKKGIPNPIIDYDNFPQISNIKDSESNSLIKKIPKLNIDNIKYPVVFTHTSYIIDKKAKLKKKYFHKQYLLSIKYLKFLSQENLTEDFLEKLSIIESTKNNINNNENDNSNFTIKKSQTQKKIKEFLSNAKINEQINILRELDEIPNSEIKNTADYIINNINSKKENTKIKKIKTPKLIIHNIFFEWILNKVMHKTEIRNQYNEVVSVEYVINLLNKEVKTFKKNIINYVSKNEKLKKKQIENSDNEDFFSPYYNSDEEFDNKRTYLFTDRIKNNKTIKKIDLDEMNTLNSVKNNKIYNDKIFSDDEEKKNYYNTIDTESTINRINKNNKLNPLSFSSNTSNITRNIRSNISIGTMTEKTYNSNSNNKLFFSNNNIDSTNDDFSERNSHRKDLSYGKSAIITNKKKEFITNRDRENVIFENTNENFNLTKKSFRNGENEYLYNSNNNINNKNNGVINKNLPKIFDNNKFSNLNSNTNSLQMTKRTDNNYTKTDKISFSGSNTERDRYEIFNPKITQQSNNYQNIMIMNNNNNNNNNYYNTNNNNNNYSNINNNNYNKNKNKDNNNYDNNNYYNNNNYENDNYYNNKNNYDNRIQNNNIESYENRNDFNSISPIKQNKSNIITEKNSQSIDSMNRTKKKIGFQEEKNTYSKIDNYNKNNENESYSENNESNSENYENEEEEYEEEEENEESISKKRVSLYSNENENENGEIKRKKKKRLKTNKTNKSHKSRNKSKSEISNFSSSNERNNEKKRTLAKRKTEKKNNNEIINNKLEEEEIKNKIKTNHKKKEKTIKIKEEDKQKILQIQNKKNKNLTLNNIEKEEEENEKNKKEKIKRNYEEYENEIENIKKSPKSKIKKEKKKEEIIEDNYNPLIGAEKLKQEQQELIEQIKKREKDEEIQKEINKKEEEKRLENQKRVQEFVKKQQEATLINPASNYTKNLYNKNNEQNEFLRQLLLRSNPNFFNQEKFYENEENKNKNINKQYYNFSNEKEKNENNEENEIKNNKKILMGRGSEDNIKLIYDNSYLFKKKENEENNNFQLRKEVQDILEGKYKKKIIEEEPKIKTEYKFVRKKKFIKESPKKIKPKKKLQNKIKTFQIEDESEDEELKKKLEEKRKEEEEEKKRQINYDERLKNFFKKIQALKEQSNDKLGEELDKLIDDQIYNSDYGINRRIESRMNYFLGRLNYYVLQKENYRKLKQSNLRFKSPCEFETSKKRINSLS